MKADIHPDYHEITVVRPNGESYKTRSTYGKAGDTIRLDVDPGTHPAWNKGSSYINENAGQIDKFKKRFANFKPKGAATAKKEDKKDEATN